MIQNQIHTLSYEALMLILILSGPPILISMILGLMVAIFQAATQIQEQTLSFTVKLVAVMFTIMMLGGWLSGQIVQFTTTIFTGIAKWSGN
ncbi:MAG: sctS [Parachlamydiales bacterium]|nr:sctS [Parachlamydiales bacterium]